MKLQNLAIIFLVISIPLILILSYYLNLQQKTLELQAQYDTKLAEATKEGVKAFEINTVDWTDWITSQTSANDRKNALATVNTFLTSLANNLNISGTAKEYMINYIPAITITMYDGYYIYAPTYVPVTIQNTNGTQRYYDPEKDAIVDQVTTDNQARIQQIYEPADDADSAKILKTNRFIEDDIVRIHTEYISFVTDLESAKKEYKHILNNKLPYAQEYTSGVDTDVVVNYTLDNRIYVYGKVRGANIKKDGYLVYFDSDSVMPLIKVKNNAKKEEDITITKSTKDTIYNGTYIEAEELEEQLVYKEGTTYHIGTFKYIYDINHDKLYYDETADDGNGGRGHFFVLNDSTKEKDYIAKGENVTVGSAGIRYKSVSVLLGDNNTTEYKKIYQILNGKDKGKWCISIKEENSKENNNGVEIVDTYLKDDNLNLLGLKNQEIYKDFSAISYYVEAYAFTNWTKQNLGAIKTTVEETENTYIFKISEENDPEKDTSSIAIHKKEIMKNHITTNLNLAISNYSRRSKDFKMPVLTDNDWKQIFSNISLITFLQGMPIGLKTYNNYAIATSTTNREYVDPGELYFTSQASTNQGKTLEELDKSFHTAYCSECGENLVYTGYRSVEYVMREYGTDTKHYYYPHDNLADTSSETACYYCLINRANFRKTTSQTAINSLYKSYNEALARERYYQKVDIEATVKDNEDIQITVRRKALTVTDTKIVFVIDTSGSMKTNDKIDNLKTAMNTILNAIGNNSTNYYIAAIEFGEYAVDIGTATNATEIENLKAKINALAANSTDTRYDDALFLASQKFKQNAFWGQVDQYKQKVMVFLTDGKPSKGHNGRDQVWAFER